MGIGFLNYWVTTYNILTTMSHLMAFFLLLSVMMMMVDAAPKPKTEEEPKPSLPEFGYPSYFGGNTSARSWRRDPVKACRGRNEGAECALCTFRSYQCKGKCPNRQTEKDRYNGEDWDSIYQIITSI